MVIINHFINARFAELEVRKNYVKDFNQMKLEFHALKSLGFEFNKTRRTFYKRYSKEATDIFDRDITELKNTFKYYKLRSYKLVNVDTNVESVIGD